MSDGDARIEVRSFRSVFDLERRIYRIDRLRLNPGGIPVRGAVYLLTCILLVAVGARLPVLGWPLDLLPWYARVVLLPAGVAALLTVIRVDGRPFHVAVRALAGFMAGPRRLQAFAPCPRPGQRWHPGELTILPDGSEPWLRAFTYLGAGAVLVLRAHQQRAWDGRPLGGVLRRAQIELRPVSGGAPLSRGRVLALSRGCRLTVADGDCARGQPKRAERMG